MTEIRVLDYAWARPSIAAIKASGAVGVMRYLCRSTSAKRLTAGEAQQLRAAGLQVGVVYEDAATRATQGYAAGMTDAVEAEKQARALGLPTSCPIFFAVDYDLQWSAVAAYFQGVRAAGMAWPIGVYGSCDIVEGAHAAGIPWLWQTVAWSRGKVSPHAHLYQRNRSAQPVAGTDENVVIRPLPLWGVFVKPQDVVPPKPLPTPTPKPAPIPKDADMALIAKDPTSQAQWVVATDLSSKSPVQDGDSYRELLKTEAYHEVALTAKQLDSIPTVKA